MSLVSESAEGGHGGAMYYMALHNYSETGSEVCFKEEILLAAEEGNDPDAMAIVGESSFHGSR